MENYTKSLLSSQMLVPSTMGQRGGTFLEDERAAVNTRLERNVAGRRSRQKNSTAGEAGNEYWRRSKKQAGPGRVGS